MPAIAAVLLVGTTAQAQQLDPPELNRPQTNLRLTADVADPVLPGSPFGPRRSKRSAAPLGRALSLADAFAVPRPLPTAETLVIQDSEGYGPVPEDPPSELPSGADALLTRKMTQIRPDLDYAWGDVSKFKLPDEFYAPVTQDIDVQIAPRPLVLHWIPTNAWYHPLYFEDAPLERYGHTCHPVLQPFVSTGRFLGRTVALPYQAALHPPYSQQYSLGWHRPGDCVPKLKYKVPLNEEAAVTEALAVIGLVFLIP